MLFYSTLWSRKTQLSGWSSPVFYKHTLLAVAFDQKWHLLIAQSLLKRSSFIFWQHSFEQPLLMMCVFVNQVSVSQQLMPELTCCPVKGMNVQSPRQQDGCGLQQTISQAVAMSSCPKTFSLWCLIIFLPSAKQWVLSVCLFTSLFTTFGWCSAHWWVWISKWMNIQLAFHSFDVQVLIGTTNAHHMCEQVLSELFVTNQQISWANSCECV